MATDIGIGKSTNENSYDAGVEAARKALGMMGKSNPELSIVFFSARYDMQEATRGVSETMGRCQVLGCSTAGELTPEGLSKESLAVLAFRSDTIKFKSGISHGLCQNSWEAGAKLGKIFEEQFDDSYNLTAMLLPDGLSGNGAEIVRGLYSVMGPNVQMVGGSAGDDLKLKGTYQFYGAEVFQDSMPGVLFLSESPFGVSVRHGLSPVSMPMLITKAEGNILQEIDGEPAVNAYLKYFNLSLDAKGIEALGQLPESHQHPLGMPELGDEYLMRHFINTTPDGSIICTGEMHQDSIVRIMTGTPESLMNAAKEAVAQAKISVGDRKIKLALVFDCVSRLWILQDRAAEEIEAIRSVLGKDVPLFGFLTYGEIGKFQWGQPQFHNITVVVCLITE
ncbi:MAG: FIST C-terminal domain-containing protein [Firmicutes bacterium]|nr:FIST C-terminal domain-containing protein [Bacillota bacterium]